MSEPIPGQPLFMAFTAYTSTDSVETYEIVVDMRKFISLYPSAADQNYSYLRIDGHGEILLHGTPKAILGIE